MKLSDKIILTVVALTVLLLTVDYLRSGPDPAWSQVKKGVSSSEIHHLAGPPDQSKTTDTRIEILSLIHI